MKWRKGLITISMIFICMNPINEEIIRIKQMMGLITESVTLPITISGSYQAPRGDGDALHSFDRRKSDGFGGYMLRGGPIPQQFASRVILNQGKGINQVLKELIDQGISPDVTNIDIKVNDDYTVEWSATIDKSKDGKAYAGVMSRGSAGGGADSRAQGQLPDLKRNNPNFCNWTTVLDFSTNRPIRIRQHFLKYTICGPNETPNDIQVQGGSVENKKSEEFKTWESGEYKIPGDEMWTYKLNDEKDWEAKKDNGSYTLLRTSLSSDNYNKAMETLKTAKKV